MMGTAYRGIKAVAVCSPGSLDRDWIATYGCNQTAHLATDLFFFSYSTFPWAQNIFYFFLSKAMQ
jgi:hypothetical protein